MSDRNDEIAASHQASSAATEAIHSSTRETEEFLALLAKKRRIDEARQDSSPRGFFANLLRGLRGESPDSSEDVLGPIFYAKDHPDFQGDSPSPDGPTGSSGASMIPPTPPGGGVGMAAAMAPPAGLEKFVENPFAHLREARASRQEAMTPAMPTPTAPTMATARSSGPTMG